VNPSLGIYKCYGCGAGGDVIKFVQEIESISFWEAVTSLAERNGVPVPKRKEISDAQGDLRAAVAEMNAAAARIFIENLYGAEGAEARDYLGQRGLTQAVAEQFGIGYSLRVGAELYRRLARQFSPEAVQACGLFGQREDGSWYDRFRGRLMFPIHNESGRVIAFGGRALRSGDEPKYLNSPETLTYKKSQVLYNLHRAKETIRKQDVSVLVEGYMDVIGVYSAGVRNVVATCGTALVSDQVRVLKRSSSNIVINFDGDSAGASATERSVQILLEEGMHVRVLELEQGLDPDEHVRKHGPAAYSSRLSGATNYFIWLAMRARQRFDMSSAEGRMAAFEALLLPAIRRIHDRLERAAVATEVADFLGVDRSIVTNEFRRFTSKDRGPAAPSRPESIPVPVRERLYLRTVLLSEESRNLLIPAISACASARKWVSWPIFEQILAMLEIQQEFGYAALEARLDEGAKRLLSATFFADKSDDVMSAEQARAETESLRKEDEAEQVQALRKQIQTAERAGNMDEALRLMLLLEQRTRGQKR
jgi:DNA primase